jgi:DNA polymerase-3 subunit gamma/tau
MAKALYRKWRPQIWDEVTAQDPVIQTLRNAVVNDRVAHAYLFAGPRGTGKTTTARLLAKAINCLEPDLNKRPCNTCEICQTITQGRFMDLIEIDAASNTSVDDVRDLRDKINFSPSQGKFKVYIIDEVHMLSTAAFNALLKTLEEPPPHAIFILATTEIHKIPATVLSRCQRFEFRRIPVDDIVRHLEEKSKIEGLHVSEGVFTEIARQATGSLRDAISLLDQLTSTSDNVSLEMAQEIMGTATSTSVIEIIDALIAKDASKGLERINKALDGGADPRQLSRQIVSYLRNILMLKMKNDSLVELSGDARKRMFLQSEQMSLSEVIKGIEAFNKATNEEHANWHPGLGLELAFTSYLMEPERISEPSTYETAPTVQKKVIEQPPQQKTRPKSKTTASTAEKPEKQGSKTAFENDETTQEVQNKADKPEDTLEESSVDDEPVLNGEGITINQIQGSWKEIKAKVKQHNPRTVGLMNSCKLSGVKDNMLLLGFTSGTLKDMMEKEGNINLLSDILSEVIGKPMRVKCIITSKQGGTVPPDLEIEQDGMVSTATRDLGGRISSAQEDN